MPEFDIFPAKCFFFCLFCGYFFVFVFGSAFNSARFRIPVFMICFVLEKKSLHDQRERKKEDLYYTNCIYRLKLQVNMFSSFLSLSNLMF